MTTNWAMTIASGISRFGLWSAGRCSRRRRRKRSWLGSDTRNSKAKEKTSNIARCFPFFLLWRGKEKPSLNIEAFPINLLSLVPKGLVLWPCQSQHEQDQVTGLADKVGRFGVMQNPTHMCFRACCERDLAAHKTKRVDSDAIAYTYDIHGLNLGLSWTTSTSANRAACHLLIGPRVSIRRLQL